jgi:hypothetical protein
MLADTFFGYLGRGVDSEEEQHFSDLLSSPGRRRAFSKQQRPISAPRLLNRLLSPPNAMSYVARRYARSVEEPGLAIDRRSSGVGADPSTSTGEFLRCAHRIRLRRHLDHPPSVRSWVYCDLADIRDRLRGQNHNARGRRTYFGSDARVTRRMVAASRR